MSDFHVFTTVLVRNNQAQFLDEHLERLIRHAEHFSITHPGKGALRDLAQQRFVPGTYLLRMAITPNSNITFATRDLNVPKSYEAALVVISDAKVDSRFGRYKTSHSEPYRLARSFALEQGAFEGLLLDEEGYVVDGSRTSPLLFSDGSLISLEGGLAGITREKVLCEASKLGITVRREKRRAHELQGVLLVAGSGVGLVSTSPVTDPLIRKLVDQFQID